MKKRKQLTGKQQAFARGVAQGLSLSDAYREAYEVKTMRPASIRVEASKLMQHPEVALMVDRLRAAQDAATVHMVVSDRDRILSRLRTLLEAPEGTPAESISIKAEHLLGQTLGMYQKRVEVDDKRDRTPEEIRREIEERIASLESADVNLH